MGDPPNSELCQWYQRRVGGGNARRRKIGVAALAGELVGQVGKYVEHGEVPPGEITFVDWQAKLNGETIVLSQEAALAQVESACEKQAA